MRIRFRDMEHKKFFLFMKEKCPEWNTYYKTLMYILGICKECRDNIDDLLPCFENSATIYMKKNRTALSYDWHTQGSIACVKLAFALLSGYINNDVNDLINLLRLFDQEYAIYFVEALKIYYPQYFTTQKYCVKKEDGEVIRDNFESLSRADVYRYGYEKENNCHCIVEKQKKVMMNI